MKVSQDKQHAVIEIKGTYGTADLEDLIARLSAMRAAMVPAVPDAPPATNPAEDPGAARARGIRACRWR